MNVLGLSAFYHDSAACLLRDGEVIAAASYWSGIDLCCSSMISEFPPAATIAVFRRAVIGSGLL